MTDVKHKQGFVASAAAARRSSAAVIAPPGPPVVPAHRTVIEPPRRWQWLNLGELWRYRELLFFLAWRDVKVRYKQTVLGAAWAVLQPAMMMVVFSIFFGRIGKVPIGDTPAPLFYL